MTPADMALALMLLSAPVGTPEPPITEARLGELRPCLVAAGAELRLGNEEDFFYSFRHPSRYQYDLDDWRAEQAALADAPDLPDLGRFPPFGYAIRASNTAAAFRRDYLEPRLEHELDRRGVLERAARDCRWAESAWDHLFAAARPESHLWVRRHALKSLREQIGPADFAAGRMPPPIPAWCTFEVHMSAVPVKLVPEPEPAPLPRPR